MPIDKIPLSKALTKPQFHALLSDWFFTSAEPVIAPGVLGPTGWVHVASDSGRYRLHADTSRDGVRHYLSIALSANGDPSWTVVVNARGKENAVAFEDDHVRIPGFYLYLVD